MARHSPPPQAAIQVGIPACDELAWLPRTLEDLACQTDSRFEVWVCVNHARDAFEAEAHHSAVLENMATLAFLRRAQKSLPFRLHILDATGAGAPSGSEAGVGWARRHLFETIFAERGTAAIGVSLDADTRVAPDYVKAIQDAFEAYSNALSCAVPYWHDLPADSGMALQLLRYEIYLRYYHLNLWRIGSPYALTALGSALAFRGDAYHRVGGFPLRQAGEDFYLLQQFRKMGPAITWLPTTVRPASRRSQRVPFGTGILLEPGAMAVLETRFPFYALVDFEYIGATYAGWATWYEQPGILPIQAFIDARLGGDSPFLRMRKNATSRDAFVRACHGRLDGLKLLQCLRFYRSRNAKPPSEGSQIGALLEIYGISQDVPPFQVKFLPELEKVRMRLWELESRFQREAMARWSSTAKW